MVSYHYGYTDEYVCSKSPEWRNLKIKEILRDESSNRLHDLKMTSMSHQPGTESGATSLQSSFRQETTQLLNLLKFASDAYAEDIEEADEEDADDGIVRYTE